MSRTVFIAAATTALFFALPVAATTVRTDLRLAMVDGPGESVGTVTITSGRQGAVIRLHLHGLPPGQHGMHLHQNASCAPATGADGKVTLAGAAGAHFDPDKTGHHMGPEGQGHLGDLPRVDVDSAGNAKATLKAPRIKDVAALKGRSLMLHAGGDNYADTPPLGGGGPRLACGVLK